MGMFVTLAYGKFNFAEYAGSVGVLLVTAPFVRTSAVNAGVQRGAKMKSMPGTIDIHGAYFSQQVELPAGSVIALQVARTYRGASHLDGTLFVKLRPEAAHIRISKHIPPVQQRRMDSQVLFDGNADFMTVEDLAAEGIIVSPQYQQRFLSLEDIERCFSIVEVYPERAPQAQMRTIHTQEGDREVRIAAAPMRRLRIGGR